MSMPHDVVTMFDWTGTPITVIDGEEMPPAPPECMAFPVDIAERIVAANPDLQIDRTVAADDWLVLVP